MPRAPSLSLMLLLITVMCVIAEKKLQLNSASLYVVVIFIIGGILIEGVPGPLGPPPLATPMNASNCVIKTRAIAICLQIFSKS